MIRTALTLNISPQDSQNSSFLANGTHLGLLSQSAQNTHIQTSHRPSQLIVAIRTEDTSSAALTVQRQQVNAWQDFARLLARRGTADLNNLMQQYHLQPDWLICLDEFRLQAWLPADAGFYLLRQESLRRLRPVTLHDMARLDEDQNDDRQYYALSLAPADQFFLLPPAVLNFYATGEAAGILLGLRQLPTRMGDLFNTARQRGFSGECTWLALQILHLEPDELPDVVKHQNRERLWSGVLSFLRTGSQPSEETDQGRDSLSNADGQEPSGEAQASRAMQIFLRRRWLWTSLAAVFALAVIVVIVIFVNNLFTTHPTVETTLPSTTTTAATPTPTLTPTPKPTAKPTPVPTLPKLTVVARQLNLREGPTRDSKLLATLKSGDVLSKLAEPEGDWVKVKTADGLIGYVYYSYVAEATP